MQLKRIKQECRGLTLWSTAKKNKAELKDLKRIIKSGIEWQVGSVADFSVCHWSDLLPCHRSAEFCVIGIFVQSGRFPTGLSVSFTMLHMSWVLQVLLRYWWRPPLTAPDSPVQGVPCSRSSPTGTIFLCRSPSCVCCKIKMVLPHIYVQSWFYTGLYISFAANNFLLHRPYIVRFTIFTLLFVPSTKALLKSLATAF